MTRPTPDKLKILWQKGRNYFSSFFVELGDVRKALGDDREFASWCITDLHIGLDALTHMSNVLKKTDAQIVKRDLAAANAIEREDKARKRAAERKARDEERARAAIEKAQKKEQAKRDAKKKRNAAYRKRKKAELQARYAANAKKGNGSGTAIKSDKELSAAIKEAQSRLIACREDWIEASIELAVLLCHARAKHPNDHVFSAWLDEHEIHINRTDRAALLNLGTNPEAMRAVLQQTKRSSYQSIWKEVTLSLETEA